MNSITIQRSSFQLRETAFHAVQSRGIGLREVFKVGYKISGPGSSHKTSRCPHSGHTSFIFLLCIYAQSGMCREGITRFIQSRNSRFRVRLVDTLRPRQVFFMY